MVQLSCFGQLSSTHFGAKEECSSDPDEVRAAKMLYVCPEHDTFCHHLEDVPRSPEVEWISCWLTPLNQRLIGLWCQGGLFQRGPFSLKTGGQTISGCPFIPYPNKPDAVFCHFFDIWLLENQNEHHPNRWLIWACRFQKQLKSWRNNRPPFPPGRLRLSDQIAMNA